MDASGVEAAFVGNSSIGYQFLYANGATSTFAEGINDSDQVSGVFTDIFGASHGFMATPAPTSKDQCKRDLWQIYGVISSIRSMLVRGIENSPLQDEAASK